VTIIIREESDMSTDATTELKKNADLDMALEEWVKVNFKNFAIEGGAQGANPPAVRMNGSRNLKGEAKVERTDSFLARITAEVVDVKPNGTFAVQARKVIRKDDEVQEFLLTGICRGADVTPDNTVLSSQVYNLELSTKHKGAVRDTTKRGLIPKLLDFINPF
jgi:flagellar L-ring protein precursor FlgH